MIYLILLFLVACGIWWFDIFLGWRLGKGCHDHVAHEYKRTLERRSQDKRKLQEATDLHKERHHQDGKGLILFESQDVCDWAHDGTKRGSENAFLVIDKQVVKGRYKDA